MISLWGRVLLFASRLRRWGRVLLFTSGINSLRDKLSCLRPKARRDSILLLFSLVCCSLSSSFATSTVNVYVWGGEIPRQVIDQFEKESGIKVNFSTYDSNETLYAKLMASSHTSYDVILPSSYYVQRLRRQHRLTYLNTHQLPNLKYLDPAFAQLSYDFNNHYSIPLYWGITGIFYNAHDVLFPPVSWHDFWKIQKPNQLLLLDDAREVFSMALLALGYSPNSQDPNQIKQAFQALVQLIPTIKLFASDAVQGLMIDEEASIGMAWNGDVFKANHENPLLNFVYPHDGFVLWVDCLAIPRHAPHLKEAYEFINFMLKPQIAAQLALFEGHSITNQTGRGLLPKEIQDNPTLYPPTSLLQKADVQQDVGEETTNMYNTYWEKFKLTF